MDYGVLETKDGILTHLREKPRTQYEVSMGIYMASRAIVPFIPANKAYGFDQLMLRLIDEKKPVKVQRFSGYWLDIGRPDDYAQAIDEFQDMKAKFWHGE